MTQRTREQTLPLSGHYSRPVVDVGEVGLSRNRWAEALPGLVSWVVLLAPIWLTLLDNRLGVVFVTVATMYFAWRASAFGFRSLLNRRRILGGAQRDWLADLERLPNQDWRKFRYVLMIRAFREGNRAMLRQTLDSIYRSNWPRENGPLHHVQVVFATEEDDHVTPPLVEELAQEYAGRLVVRQIRHPKTPSHLPGPSSAMHYAGKVLYQEALQAGIAPQYFVVADFDSDTVFHPQYLPCLAYNYATDPDRQRHAYQPVVLFTTDYWHAPLHSRLSAVGTSVLTLGWNRRPEIAFTGAAASLALLGSVDFWPTNSHSQDSGIELRLRMRYGDEFRVVGLPVPLHVYPVMETTRGVTFAERVRAYLQSFRILFRQSARWREGPLDEFVESVDRGRVAMAAYKLWNGVERDTLTLLPAAGAIVVNLILRAAGVESGTLFGTSTTSLATSALLSTVSLLGIVSFGQVLFTRELVHEARPVWRVVVEFVMFWIVFPFYIPVVTAIAGLKTSTSYLLGKRPRGHYEPTPK